MNQIHASDATRSMFYLLQYNSDLKKRNTIYTNEGIVPDKSILEQPENSNAVWNDLP